MPKEKSLIESKNTLFNKIKSMIKSIFKKEKLDNKINNSIDKYEKDNADKVDDKNKEYKERLLQLQNQYEAGIKKEEEMTIIEKELLKILYKKQIETLQTDIKRREDELMVYREKISKIKESL
ncbi:MAG: hypothetical protein J6C46_10620 [Clostridia bacterium]|nr:hypothetical protein [Clostridia bacterium]